jgi:hypothetical protein
MTVLTTESMLDVEANLDRSFFATVVVFVLSALWPVFLNASTLDRQSWAGPSQAVWSVVLCGCYVWFAIASMKAADCVGRSKWLVGAWVLVAPFAGAFALIPWVALVISVISRGLIPAPLIAMGVGVSPLALKFILARELRDDIHDKTFDE